jgi:hypothetical protein
MADKGIRRKWEGEELVLLSHPRHRFCLRRVGILKCHKHPFAKLLKDGTRNLNKLGGIVDSGETDGGGFAPGSEGLGLESAPGYP